MKKENIPKDQKVYFYEGRKQKKSMIETLRRTMSRSVFTEPAILAHKISTGKYSFTWGTFYDEKGAGVVVSPNPLAMLIGSALWTATKQLKESPSLNRYLYATYENKNIDLISNSDVVFKAIDDYEIGSQKKHLRFCDYLINNPKEAIGFVEDVRSMKLRVFKFTI